MEATLKFISWVRDTACHMVPRYLDVDVAANWLWGPHLEVQVIFHTVLGHYGGWDGC